MERLTHLVTDGFPTRNERVAKCLKSSCLTRTIRYGKKCQENDNNTRRKKKKAQPCDQGMSQSYDPTLWKVVGISDETHEGLAISVAG